MTTSDESPAVEVVAHEPTCRYLKARRGAVGIECKHGFDVCGICDPCTCGPFQPRVQPWMRVCFGDVIPFDKIERADRFIEEALELVQTTDGFTVERAHALVDYVFGRPVGEPAQEVGGVMVTLAALCLANGLDMHTAGEAELTRIWTKVDVIRAKQAAKPTGSALPVATIPTAQAFETTGFIQPVDEPRRARATGEWSEVWEKSERDVRPTAQSPTDAQIEEIIFEGLTIEIARDGEGHQVEWSGFPEVAERLRELFAGAPHTSPTPGYVLVPVEATEDMLHAGGFRIDPGVGRDCYRAMVRAALQGGEK